MKEKRLLPFPYVKKKLYQVYSNYTLIIEGMQEANTHKRWLHAVLTRIHLERILDNGQA